MSPQCAKDHRPKSTPCRSIGMQKRSFIRCLEENSYGLDRSAGILPACFSRYFKNTLLVLPVSIRITIHQSSRALRKFRVQNGRFYDLTVQQFNGSTNSVAA